MAILKSSSENLTLNADGSGNDILFQSNGVQKASLTDAGVFTATSFAGSGANLTGVGVAGISSSANATAMTIDSSENIGMGNTNPSSYDGGAHQLVIGDPSQASAGMTLSAGTNNIIYFAKGTSGADAFMGSITYNHASNYMNFRTNGFTERMRITSAGRVGINKTAPDGKLEVLAGSETGLVVKTSVSGELGGIFQSVTTNRTSILEVRNNGGGSAFRVQGNDETVIGDSGWGTLPNNAEETLLVTRNGAVIMTIFAGENSSARDAILQLQTRNTAAQCRIRFLNGSHAAGTGSGQIQYNPDGHFMAFDANATERFRITSNGVTFNGDTAASNALDDYEEGTHTTAITMGTGTATLNNKILAYTKIGRQVHVSGQINISAVSNPSGTFKISLPFTCATAEQFFSAGNYRTYVVDTPNDGVSNVIFSDRGTAFASLEWSRDGASPTNENATNGGYFMIGLTYFTD